MKTLAISISIALVGIVVVFAALSLVGIDKSVAGTIASAIVGGIPHIRETLEKQTIASAGRRARLRVLSFEGFGLSPQRLIFYGALIVFAATQAASGFGGMLAGMAIYGGAPESFNVADLAKAGAVVNVVVAMVVLPTMFLVGRWVGRRGVSKTALSVFLIAAFAIGASRLLDLALVTAQVLPMSESEFKLWERAMSGGSEIWEAVLYGAAALFAVGCLGLWRGRRQRLGAYLAYLLEQVPSETREAIVDLAFTEAARKIPSTG